MPPEPLGEGGGLCPLFWVQQPIKPSTALMGKIIETSTTICVPYFLIGRVHRRVHQEEKPHKCEVEGCDKAFKTPAELSRHAFRHTGEKPHKCDQCEKAFIRYDDLKRHYRIHTGKKYHLRVCHYIVKDSSCPVGN